MRKNILLLACLVVIAACSPSNDSSSTTSFRPAVGSLFFYTQAMLDSSGQVDPSSYRTDSVWRVLATDAIVDGFTHVMQFASGDSVDASYHPQRMNVRYLDNGDVAVSEGGSENDLTYWLILPFGSRGTTASTIDTTLDTHDGVFHITASIQSQFVGTAIVTLGPKPLDALVALTTLTAIMIRGADTGRFVMHKTWTYAPSLGFFTYMKEQHAGSDVDGHPENYGTRMDLNRYQLK